MAASSASNTSISRPIDTGLVTDVFLNGFGWSDEAGLFIPVVEGEILLNEPQPWVGDR